MTIVGWIIVGLIAGSFAQSVVGVRKRGCAFTIVVGIVGAFIGGALFQSVGSNGELRGVNLGSIFTAFIGASVLCLALRVLDRR